MSDLTVRLATVELQLLLQCLRTPELLQFARCNRRLIAASEHPLCWKFTSLPVTVASRLSAPLEVMQCDRVRSRIPVSVHWVVASMLVADPDVHAALALLEPMYVRELILVNPLQFMKEQLAHMLSSPVITTHLRTLQFANGAFAVDSSIAPIIARCMPQLTTLHFGVVTSDAWAQFASLPALTCLSFTLSENPSLADTRQLGLCRSLKDLAITFHARADSMRCFTDLPPASLPHAERLTLVGWRGKEAVDAAGLLKAMPAVHTLTLRECAAADSLLRNLARTRSRTLLRLLIQLDSNSLLTQATSKCVPTAPVLVCLLAALRSLRCDLELIPPPESPPPDSHTLALLETLRINWMADAALQSLGERLRIL